MGTLLHVLVEASWCVQLQDLHPDPVLLCHTGQVLGRQENELALPEVLVFGVVNQHVHRYTPIEQVLRGKGD